MNNSFLTKIAHVGLAVLISAVIAQTVALAQDERTIDSAMTDERFGYARDLEGTWNAQVTFRNCLNGTPLMSFTTLNTFMRGGTMMHSSASVAPVLRGTGHGVWEHENGRNYTFAVQFFRFNADGTYAGYTIGRRQTTLSRFGSSYTATVAIEHYSPAGVLVGTGCATETGARFQ